MKFSQKLNFVPSALLETALNDWKDDSRTQRIITLLHPEDEPLINSTLFFEAVLNSFPLDPPRHMIDSSHWDDIQDALRGGLWNIDEQVVDIVWPQVHKVAGTSIPTLLHGVTFLLEAMNSFLDRRWDKGGFARLLLSYEKGQSGFDGGSWFSTESNQL